MAKRTSRVRLLGCVGLLAIAFWFTLCAMVTPLGPWLGRAASGLVRGVANLPGIAWLRGEMADTADETTPIPGTSGEPSAALRELLQAGLALQKEDKPQEALERYLEALQLDEQYAPTHAALASVYEQFGQVDKAIEELERAAELAPENSAIQTQLGRLYLRQESYDAAIAALERATQIEPEDAEIRSLLGTAYLYRAHDDLQRSIAALEKSIALDAENAQSRFYLAMAYIQRDGTGDVERALEQLEKSLALDAEQTAIYFYLGQLYARSGNTKKAIDAWRRYVEVGQDSEAVAQVQAWLKSLEAGSN